MKPLLRLTLVMEQTLGHIPFSQNLRQAFENDDQVKVNWIAVNFPYEGRIEKLPLIRSNWSIRGSLKARQAIHSERKRLGSSDLYLFHTQVVSLLSAPRLSAKTPVIISLDATPLNYDRVGAAYGHKPGNSQLEKLKFWLNRRAFNSAKYLVTWSRWAKDSLVKDYGVAESKIAVIPPGTNLNFWENKAGPKPAHPQGKIKLLFVGGDLERKGGKLLYDVFRERLSEICELHLVTKGDVPAGNGVFVYRNIAPNSPELQALFHQADVFVLPTQGDCLPLAIGEAMAAGLPVVSTDVGAIGEAISPGENGYLITPGDATGLAQVLTQLAGDAELRRRLGANSRRRAETMFDARQNGQRLLEICKNLLEPA